MSDNISEFKHEAISATIATLTTLIITSVYQTIHASILSFNEMPKMFSDLYIKYTAYLYGCEYYYNILKLLNIFVVIMFTYTLFTLLRKPKCEDNPNNIATISSKKAVNVKKVVAIIFLIFFCLITYYYLFSLPISLISNFEHDMRLIRPYLSESYYITYQSEFIRMNNIDEYYSIYDRINAVIEYNNLY